MRFNHHFQNHFGGCHLLAKAYDPHRQRDVELRMIPGEFDIVGVTDGVDCWVCPTMIDPFGVNLTKMMRDIRDTGVLPTVVTSRRRRLIEPTEPEAPRPRRRLITDDAPDTNSTPRKRLHVSA